MLVKRVEHKPLHKLLICTASDDKDSQTYKENTFPIFLIKTRKFLLKIAVLKNFIHSYLIFDVNIYIQVKYFKMHKRDTEKIRSELI